MLDRSMFLKILLILLLALGFLAIYRLLFEIPAMCQNYCQSKENMISIPPEQATKWARSECKYDMNQTMINVLSENKLDKSDKDKEDWMLYFPCGYDDIDEEIKAININNANKNKRFFIIHDADNMTAKDELWKHVVAHHGLAKAKTLMPMTYVLGDKAELDKIKADFSSNKLYILKKNIQRQEGLKITDNLSEILGGPAEGYVVVQELLQNPYTIGGRKINMRFYVLVVCKGNSLDVYVYRNGFMYYTKEPFVKGSKSVETNITTGYIDREIYKISPLTHDDFRDYLDKPRELSATEEYIRNQGLEISKVVFNKIYGMLKDVFMAYIGKICTGEKLREYVSFQLFGVDVAVDDHLNAMIIEQNKGPNLSAHDERDGQLKHDCVRDMFRKLGVINETNESKNGFVRLIEYENGKLL